MKETAVKCPFTMMKQNGNIARNIHGLLKSMIGPAASATPTHLWLMVTTIRIMFQET